MIVKSGRNDTYYYVCGLKTKSNGIKCQSENIHGNKLDNHIIKLIKELESNKATLTAELEKRKKYIISNTTTDIPTLLKKLNSNKKEIENLVEKLAKLSNSSIEKYIVDKIELLDSENKALQAQIEKFENLQSSDKEEKNKFEEFIKTAVNFSSCVDNMSFEEKKNIVHSLISKVVQKDNEIEITFASGHTVSIYWNNMLVDERGTYTWEKLKYWRCKRGYLQKEVACAVGISRGAYLPYEKPDSFCPPDILAKIAQFLDVEFDELAEDFHYFMLSDNQCQRIKNARKKLNLSVDDFAKLADVSRSTAYKWEKEEGRLSRRNYMQIRKYTEL
jgi:DNA-binding XRE family transcriptional regulator